jgi:hypothetical protein
MAEIVEDVLGIEGTFPRPGWVVLDAIRDRRFTGEVAFETTPQVHVYADRGRIYLAERASDPSLGARLVDAGALNATQLEHGAMRIGAAEHLGRLFERVPSVDRQKVIVTAELMTEECVGWLARLRISDIDVTPYRHHPSGAHRWDHASIAHEVAPGDPLPAPAPDAAPVAIAPPEPLFRDTDDLADVEDMIRWNEPSWLDEQVTPIKPIDVAGRFAALRAADVDEQPEPISLGLEAGDAADAEPAQADETSVAEAAEADEAAEAVDQPAEEPPSGGDWVDNLPTSGLPHPGSDPLASPVKLSPLAPEPPDNFELIWPSGDIDEQFGSQSAEPYPHPDIDRAGVTARLITRRPRVAPAPTPEPAATLPAGDTLEDWLGDEQGREAITDDVVLAVRRAVASIDTGSLAARRRLVDVPAGAVSADSPFAAGPVTLPGRVAVRADSPEAMPPARGHVSGTSVFDNVPPIEHGATNSETTAETPAAEEPGDTQRTSALRRLIGSLRRR